MFEDFPLKWMFVMGRAKYWVVNSQAAIMVTKTEKHNLCANMAWNPIKTTGRRY